MPFYVTIEGQAIQLCVFAARSQPCTRKDCPYSHEPKERRVCTAFHTRGDFCKDDKNCLLGHEEARPAFELRKKFKKTINPGQQQDANSGAGGQATGGAIGAGVIPAAAVAGATAAAAGAIAAAVPGGTVPAQHAFPVQANPLPPVNSNPPAVSAPANAQPAPLQPIGSVGTSPRPTSRPGQAERHCRKPGRDLPPPDAAGGHPQGDPEPEAERHCHRDGHVVKGERSPFAADFNGGDGEPERATARPKRE
jgi:hypothetical protein